MEFERGSFDWGLIRGVLDDSITLLRFDFDVSNPNAEARFERLKGFVFRFGLLRTKAYSAGLALTYVLPVWEEVPSSSTTILLGLTMAESRPMLQTT